MRYLIYLLFGKKNETNKSELIYSLLSLKKVTGNHLTNRIQVLIYTDNPFELPGCVDGIPVIFKMLKQEDIEYWVKRAHGHFFVLKAVVNLRFLEEYQSCGLLLDTDTFFVNDPEPLFQAIQDDKSILHTKEYVITERPAIYSFFKKQSFVQGNGSPGVVGPAFYMWNAGVVGIGTSHMPLMPGIISLIEKMSGEMILNEADRRLIEQTAHSYTFQQNGREPVAANEYIVHYWFLKEGRYFLANYFKYFHGSDREQFLKIIQQQNIGMDVFSKLTYDAILPTMIGMLVKHSLVDQFHLKSLPADTKTGKLLRQLLQYSS